MASIHMMRAQDGTESHSWKHIPVPAPFISASPLFSKNCLSVHPEKEYLI